MSENLIKRSLTSFVLLFVLFLIFIFEQLLITVLMIFGVLSLIEFFNLLKNISKTKLKYLFFNFLFTVYIFLFCLFFVYFSSVMHLKVILFCFVLACVASDIGGYIFGNLIKGPRLTKISPSKTYSGSIGSILLSCLIFSLSLFYLTGNFNYSFIFIAIFLSLACQIGDLFFSYLKRKARIKDSGNIFPGHGGVLDRLDGILFGVPAGFILLILLY
tara:strand:- start:8 stop:655 length:648 start_codon:yes stop_codon:yes gene_type:complete